jgi:cobalt-precorrin-6B (C15)-methyltransferase
MADNNKIKFGIKDDEFIRDKVPMTKSEVRAITLSKLRLNPSSHVLDIGCGTGSITVECGLICNEGEITAIDQKIEAIRLTEKNVKKFGLTNVSIIEGLAPKDIPRKRYDSIFLGGGSKKIDVIIDFIIENLRPGGVFVANTILLDSTYKILSALEGRFVDIDIPLVQVSKGHQLGGWMMKANNPIYVISAKLP